MPSVTITLNDIKTEDDMYTALAALGFVFDAPATAPSAPEPAAEDYFPPSEDLRAEINAAEAQKATKSRGRPRKKDAPPAESEGQQWMPFPEETTAAEEKVETVAASEATVAPDDKPVETTEAKELTLDDAKDKGRLLLMAKGADALRKLLDEYKLRKVGDLPKDKFVQFVADCERLVKG